MKKSLKPPSERDEATAAIIAGIEVREEFDREGKRAGLIA
jgi:hypothetical protein